MLLGGPANGPSVVTCAQVGPNLSALRGVVHFTTYDGNVLTLDTTYATLPTVNREQVDLAPPQGRDGPAVTSDWDGSQIVIQFQDYVHTITLN